MLLCPPSGFRPLEQVERAYYSPHPPPFYRPVRHRGRRALGVRYEKAVQQYLEDLYPTYVASPWFRFYDAGKWRWCQPDGLLFLPREGRIVLVEIKYQHTADAWWQTRRLYGPVLEAIFPSELWRIEVCEVVKWFDPATAFPEELAMVPRICERSKRLKVHIWKP